MHLGGLEVQKGGWRGRNVTRGNWLGQSYETGWNKWKKCNQGRWLSIKSSWLRNASPTLQQITEQHIIMTMKRGSSSSQHPFISSLHFLAETYHHYFSSIPSSSLTNFSPQYSLSNQQHLLITTPPTRLRPLPFWVWGSKNLFGHLQTITHTSLP